jgi:hypothetical protein
VLILPKPESESVMVRGTNHLTYTFGSGFESRPHEFDYTKTLKHLLIHKFRLTIGREWGWVFIIAPATRFLLCTNGVTHNTTDLNF